MDMRSYITKVYFYYDEPILYLAKDKESNVDILTSMCDLTDRGSTWLGIIVSEARLKEIEDGSIMLYDALKGAENATAYFYYEPYTFVEMERAWEIPSDQLPDDMLPLPNIPLIPLKGGK